MLAKNLAKVGVALVSIVVSLLIGEGLIRISGISGVTLTRGPLHEYDSLAGWTCARNVDMRYQKPGSFDVRVRCNDRGLRDVEDHPYSKPEGIERIAVLGDSFMWGFGVENEETFASVLESLGEARETINFGANGYSTVQEIVRFESEALRYQPDWAILFFTWNDLEDNFDDKHGGRPIVRIEGESITIVNSPVRRAWKSHPKQWLRHNSRIFGLVEHANEIMKYQIKEWRSRSDAASKRKGSMDFSMNEIYGSPSTSIDDAWRATEYLLDRLRRGVHETGGRLLVAYVPTQEAVDPSSSITRSRSDPELDWDRPSQRLSEICAALGITYVDLLPGFRDSPDPSALFLRNNGHWSAEGHVVAARHVSLRMNREVVSHGP